MDERKDEEELKRGLQALESGAVRFRFNMILRSIPFVVRDYVRFIPPMAELPWSQLLRAIVQFSAAIALRGVLAVAARDQRLAERPARSLGARALDALVPADMQNEELGDASENIARLKANGASNAKCRAIWSRAVVCVVWHALRDKLGAWWRQE